MSSNHDMKYLNKVLIAHAAVPVLGLILLNVFEQDQQLLHRKIFQH